MERGVEAWKSDGIVGRAFALTMPQLENALQEQLREGTLLTKIPKVAPR